jgi:hypothetical protein
MDCPYCERLMNVDTKLGEGWYRCPACNATHSNVIKKKKGK